MRVLYVANMNSDNGVSCFLMNYYRKMYDKWDEVHFATWNVYKDNFHDEIRRLGGKVFIMTSYKNNPIKFLKELREIVKNGNYDVIHAHEALVSIPWLYEANKNGVNYRIAHSHNAGMPSALKNLGVILTRPLFNRYSTHLLACSKVAGEYLFGKKVFEKNGIVIHNAIDIDKYKYDEEIRGKIREQIGVSENMVIGHVGRFNKQKNHVFLIKVFNEVLKLDNNIKLVLVGDGRKKKNIIYMCKKLGILDKVILLGIRDDVSSLMQAFDIFVLPSLYEGLPMVLVEAQSAGVPCVTSEVVTSEAKCIDEYQRMPLNKSYNQWAECILKMVYNNSDRLRGAICVKECGYEINQAVRILDEFYCGNLVV